MPLSVAEVPHANKIEQKKSNDVCSTNDAMFFRSAHQRPLVPKGGRNESSCGPESKPERKHKKRPDIGSLRYATSGGWPKLVRLGAVTFFPNRLSTTVPQLVAKLLCLLGRYDKAVNVIIFYIDYSTQMRKMRKLALSSKMYF